MENDAPAPEKKKRLTKAEKAVAVAHDVIAQLRKKKNGGYVATSGTYIRFDDDVTYGFDWHGDGDLQDALPQLNKKPCEVCALGAALLSTARLFDKVKIEDVFAGYATTDAVSIREALKNIFSPVNLSLIETAFEERKDHYVGTNEREAGKAVDFAANIRVKCKDDEDCDKKVMVAIMKNVIKNNGKFIP